VKYGVIAIVVVYEKGKLRFILPLFKSSRPTAVANGKSCGFDSLSK
jgi:hypothetical protein